MGMKRHVSETISMTMAPGYPTMKWRPWPVSCSQRF